jgi:hypothetical protein
LPAYLDHALKGCGIFFHISDVKGKIFFGEERHGGFAPGAMFFYI